LFNQVLNEAAGDAEEEGVLYEGDIELELLEALDPLFNQGG